MTQNGLLAVVIIGIVDSLSKEINVIYTLQKETTAKHLRNFVDGGEKRNQT
jgi:hypothetical protein